jgi:transcriptional regulator with XRE-family HTH domain
MPSPQKTAIGQAVREIRRREGLTQEALGFRAGLHPTWISAIETGRRDPRWSTIKQIAEGLGTSEVEIVALSKRLET